MKDNGGTGSLAIRGGRAILPDGIVEADLLIEGGRIRGVGDVPSAYATLDARGLIVAPALVDIHGDAFERQVMPRPNVFFPLETAIIDTDRQLAGNGIATAYHALTFGWEPGLRAIDRGQAFLDALARLAPRLTVEHRIQLRWETFAFEAVPILEAALRAPLTPSVAFNDHTSMSLRAFDVPIQARAFEQSPQFRTAEFGDPRLWSRLESSARRSGLGQRAYMTLLAEIWERRDEVDGVIGRVAAAARAVGAPILSHDDTQIETRDYYRGKGARIAEFPMTIEVADAARAAGDALIFGAPNAVRGGSHIGSPGAGDMVEAGLCDALASDYFYPAMLAAVARLDAERRADRAALWKLVSEGPARISGLFDRGRLAPGMRADVVLVDWPKDDAPAIRATLVAGRAAYRAEGR